MWILLLLGPYLWILLTAGLWPATALEFVLIALLVVDTRHILRAMKPDD